VRELPSMKTFGSLSPAPHLPRWLDRAYASATPLSSRPGREILACCGSAWVRWRATWGSSRTWKAGAAANLPPLFLMAKSAASGPSILWRVSSGNGARIERINWLAVRPKGLARGHA